MITGIYTIAAVLSIIPLIAILVRVRSPSAHARLSRRYFALCLLSVLAWIVSLAVLTNLPADEPVLVQVLVAMSFFAISFTVGFFVTSSIYFTRTPRNAEVLLVASPVLYMVIITLVDSFTVHRDMYGWAGDIANPILRYSWLALVSIVMIYSFARLGHIRRQLRNAELRKRLRFFMISAVTALTTALLLYLLRQVLAMPMMEAMAAGFSIVLGYPAFRRPHH